MSFVALAQNAINWNGGQRMTLRAGDTAQCTTLRPGQLYGIFIYNSAQHDNNADVSVVWSNSQPPVKITIPGTTANAGLASVGFVSGTDTQVVSVSLPSNSGIAQVEVWLGSVSMPTDTSGLDNQKLPVDGVPHEFNKYRRYYNVLPASWHELTIVSTITQFISVQFTQATANVIVVNESTHGLLDGQIVKMGPGANAEKAVITTNSTHQSTTESFQGDGSQLVWMNADSEDNAEQATISLQSL